MTLATKPITTSKLDRNYRAISPRIFSLNSIFSATLGLYASSFWVDVCKCRLKIVVRIFFFFKTVFISRTFRMALASTAPSSFKNDELQHFDLEKRIAAPDCEKKKEKSQVHFLRLDLIQLLSSPLIFLIFFFIPYVYISLSLFFILFISLCVRTSCCF